MIECKVLEVSKPGYGWEVAPSAELKVEIAKSEGPYRKGEVLESTGFYVFPREKLRWRNSRQRIDTNYRWEKA